MNHKPRDVVVTLLVTMVTQKVVRESVQSTSDEGKDQTIKTSQTVEKEVTEQGDDSRKRTVEITRERVVVQRKVRSNWSTQPPLSFSDVTRPLIGS